jgi:hypothetical protein
MGTPDHKCPDLAARIIWPHFMSILSTLNGGTISSPPSPDVWPRAIKYVFAASLLLLASACGIDKSPQTKGGDAEADYVAAKDAYLRTFAADEKRGTPYSVSGPRENAALRDLADRLRKILGPSRPIASLVPGRAISRRCIPKWMSTTSTASYTSPLTA